VNPRVRSILVSLAFFGILFAWIAAKMAYSFTPEFPSLTLLCKWDCGWYESIARQGYVSPIPPLFQDSEHSNVAFFPAYPLLGRAAALLFGISFSAALPLVSILCALLVSIALARLLVNETLGSRLSRFGILIAYPASFYLFVAYSEALYLAAMLGGTAILLARLERGMEHGSGLRTGSLILAGVALGGTRLTGFIIPGFLFLAAILLALKTAKLRDRVLTRTAIFVGGAAAGTAAFFAFCAVRFGVWNLYFWQLAIGWYKEFSPMKAFALLVNAPFAPSLNFEVLLHESRHLSWMLITTILIGSIYAGFRAIFTARHAYRIADRPVFFRCFLVFAAIAHFFIVVCGDAGPWDHWGNGLRYPMPTVYLLAVAWRDEWTPAFIRERPLIRTLAWTATLVVLAFLFALQVGYLGRFIRNEWVS